MIGLAGTAARDNNSGNSERFLVCLFAGGGACDN